MILADKIIELRKKQGWSQEELAQHLGVSRQSVSKWESAASIPDLDKIIKLSQLFGVSTDFLLKDTPDPSLTQALPTTEPELAPLRRVSLEEANTYLDLVRATAGKAALGVALCILSPVILILLGGLAEEGTNFVPAPAIVSAAGMTTLLVFVAVGVSLLILFHKKLAPYGFLEEEPIELLYGVTGIVEKQQAKYASTHTMSLVAGVALCILSAVPLMTSAAFDSDLAAIFGVDLCLILVACGVFLLVKSSTIAGSFHRLLEAEDYTREKKLRYRQSEPLRRLYWCLAVAVYLVWSFLTNAWHITWILWPCAALLFAALQGLLAALKKTPPTP